MGDNVTGLAERIMLIEWTGSFDHMRSRAYLMKEYLRRAAWWASATEASRVCDERGDGYGAYGQLAWGGIINRSLRADGVGNCAEAGGNIAEGTPVQVRVCLIRQGVLYQFSAWVPGEA